MKRGSHGLHSRQGGEGYQWLTRTIPYWYALIMHAGSRGRHSRQIQPTPGTAFFTLVEGRVSVTKKGSGAQYGAVSRSEAKAFTLNLQKSCSTDVV